MIIDLSRKVLIEVQVKLEIKDLLFDEIPTIVLVEYSNYHNAFLIENAEKLSKHTKMNNHVIKVEKSKQPSFRLIYSLI